MTSQEAEIEADRAKIHELRNAISTNIEPQKCEDVIIERLRETLLQRSQVGIRKYGVTLDKSGLSVIDWHRHHLEELLDAAAYTLCIITEMEK